MCVFIVFCEDYYGDKIGNIPSIYEYYILKYITKSIIL